MSYETYKILHLVGIIALFTSLGGMLVHALQKGLKKHPQKKLLAITHGIGLTVIAISGFGLMARMGIAAEVWPSWIFVKLLIWTFAGALMAIIPRKPEWAKGLWFGVIALGMLAAWLGVTKP